MKEFKEEYEEIKLSNITKSELIKIISNDTNISLREVDNILESFFNNSKVLLLQGKIIKLRGFGTFKLKFHKGKKEEINPKTGEKIPGKNRWKVYFEAGTDFKDKLNKLT